MADLDTGNADTLANTIVAPGGGTVDISSPLPKYTPPPIPTYTPPPLTDFNQQAADAKAKVDAAQTAAYAAYQNAGPILAAATAAQQQIAEGKKMQAAEGIRRNAIIEQKDAEFALALGQSMGFGNRNTTDIAAEIAATSKDIRAKDVAFGQKASTSFFDDPLQWLSNRFTLPSEARALQREGQQVETRLAILDTFVKASDDNHKLNVYNTRSDTTALLKASSMIIDGEARANLVTAQFEALRENNTGINWRLVKAGEDFNRTIALNDMIYRNTTAANTAFTSYQFQAATAGREAHTLEVSDVASEQARQLRIQQSNLNDIQLSIAKINSADATAKAQGETELQGRLNNLSLLIKGPRLTVQTLNMYPTALRDAVINLAMAQDPSLPYVRYGADFIKALNNYQKLPVGLASANDVTVSRLTELFAQADLGVYSGSISPQRDADKKDGGIVFQTKVLNKSKELLSIQQKDISDDKGVFSPSPLATTMSMKSLEGSVIMENMKPFLTVSPNYALKSQDVMNTALGLVSSGKMSIEQATNEITQIYKSVMLDVNQRNKLEQFGFEGLNSISGFRTGVQVSYGIISGRQIIDMTNKAAVQNVITRMSQSQELGKALTAGGVMP